MQVSERRLAVVRFHSAPEATWASMPQVLGIEGCHRPRKGSSRAGAEPEYFIVSNFRGTFAIDSIEVQSTR